MYLLLKLGTTFEQEYILLIALRKVYRVGIKYYSFIQYAYK